MPTVLSMEMVSNATANCTVPTVPASAQYRGVKFNTGTQTRLRISNGGGKHCSSPCKYSLTEGPYQLGSPALLAHWLVLTLIGPGNLEGKLKTISYGRSISYFWTSDFDLSLKIDWVTGDTTQSINYLASGDADIAITYNAAAENRSLKLSIATKRVYGFRDHFYLMGPE